MTKRPPPSRWLKRIRRKQPFPKDAWVRKHFTNGRIHNFQARDKRDERLILSLLFGDKGDNVERIQAKEIATCTPRNRCGSWACYICRHEHAQSRIDRVRRLAREVKPTIEISHLTIVVAVTYKGVGHAGTLIRDGRNRIAKFLRRWGNFRVQGRFEVDLHPPGTVDQVFKLKTLKELGYRPNAIQPALVPHLHAVLIHPRIPREIISYQLRKAFPGTRRVLLDPLRQERPTTDNLGNLVRYAYKFAPPEQALPDPESRRLTKGAKAHLYQYWQLMEELGGLDGLEFVI